MLLTSMTYREMYDHLAADKYKVDIKQEYLRPGEITDADFPMPLGDYFDIEKDMMQIGGEFLLVRDEESNFYFLCTDDCDIELLCRTYDWYIEGRDVLLIDDILTTLIKRELEKLGANSVTGIFLAKTV